MSSSARNLVSLSIFSFLGSVTTNNENHTQFVIVCAPPLLHNTCAFPPLTGFSHFKRAADMSGDGAPVDDERATRDAVTASVEAAFHFLSERKKDEESLEVQKREFAEEVQKVRADAAEAPTTKKSTIYIF